MNYSSRFFLYAPVGAFLALIIGLALFWFRASGQLSERLDALNGKEIMPGVTLHFAGKEMGGFPLRLDTIFTGFEISVETDHGPATWKSDGFAVHALAYGKPQQVFEAAGAQTFSWTNARGEHKTFTFIPGTLHASSIEDATGLLRFDLDLVGMTSPAMRASELQFHLRKDGDVLQFVIDGNTIILTSRPVSGFGDTIKSIKLSGQINHGETLNDLRAGKADWRKVVDAWDLVNGTAKIDSGTVVWGKTKLDVSGQVVAPEHGLGALLSLKMTGVPAFIPPTSIPDDVLATDLADWAIGNAKDGSVNATFTLGQEGGFIGLPGSTKTKRVY